jgi:hypothetical protein
VGDAIKLKLPGRAAAVTVTITFAVAERLPVAPVTVSLYIPAVVAELVSTINVELAAAPVMFRLVGTTEQAGTAAAPCGVAVKAQVSAIGPVNPFAGVAVTVDDPESPGAATMIAGAASVKLPAVTDVGDRTTVTLAVSTMLPDLPVTVTV